MTTRLARTAEAISLAIGLSLGPRISTAQEGSQVELDSPNPNITLNQITGEVDASGYGPQGHVRATGESWKTVCVAPCRKTLPRDAYYFVDGPGIPRSGKFLLPPGDTRLRVKPGSSLGVTGGVALVVFGGFGVLLGGAFTLSTSRDLTTAGLVSVGVGGVATIVGAILLVKSTTDVLDDQGVVIGRTSGTRITSAGLVF